MIILLFGQPASGKSTLANELIKYDNTINLDGDKWREITKNKDYSKQGRINNLKGAFDMALYLEKEGFIPILSFVTPYQELRDYLSKNAEDLVQVYLNYKGDRGRNDRFASDFEIPKDCLKLDTSVLSVDMCLKLILGSLKYELKLKKA